MNFLCRVLKITLSLLFQYFLFEFVVPVCPEGADIQIGHVDPIAALVLCQANSSCLDGHNEPFKCYDIKDFMNIVEPEDAKEFMEVPVCQDGQKPDPCNGCSDGSQFLSCPRVSRTCESNAFQIQDVPRWCGK